MGIPPVMVEDKDSKAEGFQPNPERAERGREGQRGQRGTVRAERDSEGREDILSRSTSGHISPSSWIIESSCLHPGKGDTHSTPRQSKL